MLLLTKAAANDIFKSFFMFILLYRIRQSAQPVTADEPSLPRSLTL